MLTAERVASLSPEKRARLIKSLTPKLTQYIPIHPTPKQTAFLLLDSLEAFYGGAAGGGKSIALLAGALQYVDVPGYAALILRRTFSALSLPGALLDRSHQWLGQTDATWDGGRKTWHFPNGGSLTFGYLETDRDLDRYQSAEFQYIGFDELTQFTQHQFRYMFSRARRSLSAMVPVRVRSASNPGNVGHTWVKARYVEPRVKERPFIPASISDNKYLDRDEYVRGLTNLDPVTRAQLMNGDWKVRTSGGRFKREWYEIVPVAPANLNRVRYWDFAATDPGPKKDPDWTAGGRVGVTDAGVWYIENVRRTQSTPLGVEQLIRQTAELDGAGVPIYLEQEPGASGKSLVDHYVRNVLRGFEVRGDRPTGDKGVRAGPVSSQSEAGNVKLVSGPWIPDFLDEIEAFGPECAHDDQVDCISGAFSVLGGAEPPLELY